MAAGVVPTAILEVLRHDAPAWDQPEESFDYGPGLTFNRNLVQQILPPLEKLAGELHTNTPITQLMIELAKLEKDPRPRGSALDA
jgi:hypothetical protein